MNLPPVEAKPTRRNRRRLIIAAGLVTAAGIAGQIVVLSEAFGEEAKLVAPRIDAGPALKRDLVFGPQEAAADQSLRLFKPGPGWTAEAPPAPVVAELSETAIAAAKPAPRVKLATARRPPARPQEFATAARTQPTAQAAATQIAARPSRTADSGFSFRKYVPSGADIVDRLGAVGSTVGSTVGSSLGKLMKLASLKG